MGKNDSRKVLNKLIRKPWFIIFGLAILAAFWGMEKAKRIPQYGMVFYNMGMQRASSRGVEQKLAFFQKAVHHNINLVDAHLQLALLYERLGREEEAFNSFKRVAELDYQNGLAYYKIGRYYFQKGKYDYALRYFLQADAKVGCPDDVIFYLGRIYDYLQQYDQAIFYYQGIASRFDEYTNIVYPRVVEIHQILNRLEDLKYYLIYLRRQNEVYKADQLEKYLNMAQSAQDWAVQK